MFFPLNLIYIDEFLKPYVILNDIRRSSTAGVVVSWKIPILSTRVRFPGGAVLYFSNQSTISFI